MQYWVYLPRYVYIYTYLSYLLQNIHARFFWAYCLMIARMENKLKGAIASFAPWQALLGLHSAGVSAQQSQGCPSNLVFGNLFWSGLAFGTNIFSWLILHGNFILVAPIGDHKVEENVCFGKFGWFNRNRRVGFRFKHILLGVWGSCDPKKPNDKQYQNHLCFGCKIGWPNATPACMVHPIFIYLYNVFLGSWDDILSTYRPTSPKTNFVWDHLFGIVPLTMTPSEIWSITT